MARRTCYNCVYSCCDPEEWLRNSCRNEPLLVQCANHPWWPGRMREVTGTACCNYRPKPTLPKGDAVRLIPLDDGFYAYVDAADYEWLSQWNWHMASAGYAVRHEKRKYIFMHREIMRPPQGMIVDHADGSKANNCRFNLRVCTRGQNQGNLRKRRGTGSRFKGVYYIKEIEKWGARCQARGKHYYFGSYRDEVEAARAYDRGAVELHGEFARLNSPEEWPPQRRAEVYAQRDAARQRAEDGGRRTDKQTSRVTGHESRVTASRRHRRPTQNAERKTKTPRAEPRGRRVVKHATKRPPGKNRRS